VTAHKSNMCIDLL